VSGATISKPTWAHALSKLGRMHAACYGRGRSHSRREHRHHFNCIVVKEHSGPMWNRAKFVSIRRIQLLSFISLHSRGKSSIFRRMCQAQTEYFLSPVPGQAPSPPLLVLILRGSNTARFASISICIDADVAFALFDLRNEVFDARQTGPVRRINR